MSKECLRNLILAWWENNLEVVALTSLLPKPSPHNAPQHTPSLLHDLLTPRPLEYTEGHNDSACVPTSPIAG